MRLLATRPRLSGERPSSLSGAWASDFGSHPIGLGLADTIELVIKARGTQIGLSYELRWELDGERLDLEVVGGNRERFDLGSADFFDVHHSPFFNSLPVIRDGLLEEAGLSRRYIMNFVEVPQLTATLAAQTYEPLGKRVVRYSSGTFQADIKFDLDGIVSSYSGYLERVVPEPSTNTRAV